MRTENFVPGCYALQVNGRLPQEILEQLPPKMKNRYLRSQAATEQG